MAYMLADTSAKVGFRPYHQTDAEAASSLSGLGAYYRNRPLDPWELYSDAHHVDGMSGYFLGDMGELGQNHPFKPEAWHLHGLGAAPDVTAAAVAELESAGKITQGEGDAILEGSMEFVDVLGYDPTDQSSWSSLTDLFREVNQDLQNLENEYRAAAPQHMGDAAFAQLGRDLIAKRQQYSDLAAQFVRYYALVMGSAPEGLAGLGLLPIIWVAGAAVFIVGAFIALYALRDWSKHIDVSAQTAQTAQTQTVANAAVNQTLLQRLAAAQAAGDTITAQAILKTLAATGAQPQAAAGSIESWFMTNAKWIGLGAAGLIVLGPLSQGLFGGKRR